MIPCGLQTSKFSSYLFAKLWPSSDRSISIIYQLQFQIFRCDFYGANFVVNANNDNNLGKMAAKTKSTKTPKKSTRSAGKSSAKAKKSSAAPGRSSSKRSTRGRRAKRSAVKSGTRTKNKLGVKNSLVNNINAEKKRGTSRSKKKSTVSKRAYKKMQNNWGKKK